VFNEGKSLDTSIPIHLRQGYTLTSKSAQAHDADVTVAFMHAEASAAMSAEQMLVTISRPKDELVITTNSIDVVREYTVQGDGRESAREFLDIPNVPFKQEVKRSPVDLQEGKQVTPSVKVTPSQRSKKLIDFCIGLAIKASQKKKIEQQIKESRSVGVQARNRSGSANAYQDWNVDRLIK
jgi:hypothetical protein